MVRAAMIGLGWWGKALIGAVHERGRKLVFTRGVTLDPADAAAAREKFGLEVTDDFAAVLRDPAIDAVAIATPNALHVEQVCAAAAAGKHVHCEKPLALRKADAERAAAACARAGVRLNVGFNRRYFPGMRALQRLAASGELGTLIHAEAITGHNRLGQYKEWRVRPENSPAGAMALTATGIHAVDLLVWLCGAVDTAFAQSAHRASQLPGDDVTAAALRFRSGATGTVTGLVGTPLIWRVQLYGTEGWAELRDFRRLTRRAPDESLSVEEFPDADTVRLELEAFADAIAGGPPLLITPESAIDGAAAFEAITRSIETGAVASAR